MKAVGNSTQKLRVAFLAGTLGLGGAEKQLYYMARALREAGVTVFVYSLTRGEFYEKKLEEIGCPATFLGQHSAPQRRLYAVWQQTIMDRPHILQSAHFFGNLYVTLVGRVMRNLAIGAIRSNTLLELETNATWGNALLKSPSFIIANSTLARQNAELIRNKPIAILPNVIDLASFDQNISLFQNRAKKKIVVITIARLEKLKKTEDFLLALAIARKNKKQILGVVVGDGPERQRLEALAYKLKLLPVGLKFLGRRDDIPALLSQADIFALTSQIEGFPNVILEAMVASLPVITTAAGDADILVEDGVTGFVVPHNSSEEMACRILELAESQELRREMGIKGRERVANHYSFDKLAGNLFAIYREFAHAQGNQHLLRLLNE